MADGHGRVRRSLVRLINDDNLDLYLLGTVALVFTVLGATGITDVKTLSSVVLALLALLAFSQIRSRRLTAQIRDAQRGSATALFEQGFPADLIPRRAQAHDILLVGLAMTRTVQGSRSDMAAILAAGGRIRVLVLDPTDETLVAAADRQIAHSHGPGKLRARIMMTLDDLTTLRTRTGGRLEIRVSSSITSAGFNCLDVASPNGLVCVQHYEYRPVGEATPVFTLGPADGAWFHHFVAEAQRLWDAGTDWPLSPSAAADRARRPLFADRFGPELDAAIDDAAEVFVTGVARNVMVNADYRRLERKLLEGARIRFLLVDPDSDAIVTAASRYYGERRAESVRERVLHTIRVLGELKNATDGDLSLRLTSHPVAMGVVATGVALFVQYYPYQARGESNFVLRPGATGHDVFLDEAEALWRNGKPYELAR